MAADNHLLVARIGKPHGLRGEVTVQLHTDDPESRFAMGSELTTEAVPGSGVPRVLTVSSARSHRGTWLIGFEGIPDRSGAESLRGTRLFTDVPAGPPENEDEGFYEADLVGLAVVATDGAQLGTVTALQTGAAQDLLVVELAGGGEALVPFVEAIVPEVDLEHGRVVLDPPPGLLELGTES